jgi:hypothetical protein
MVSSIPHSYSGLGQAEKVGAKQGWAIATPEGLANVI